MTPFLDCIHHNFSKIGFETKMYFKMFGSFCALFFTTFLLLEEYSNFHVQMQTYLERRKISFLVFYRFIVFDLYSKLVESHS